jgi:hypothetical protein
MGTQYSVSGLFANFLTEIVVFYSANWSGLIPLNLLPSLELLLVGYSVLKPYFCYYLCGRLMMNPTSTAVIAD